MAGAPQQFCLRWNNHQSNIVSVFEQLLHSEAFVDVTLAVEGMSIKAHKVVLSACSPYFQAVLASHPDKHPIVILKDVRYVDMRDLLDFMYRGEVSVDQDNLSGFLRVAESLRIKGLTEVNEKKRLETNTSAYLLSQNLSQSNPIPGVISSAASIVSHSDMPSLKRPPLSPTGSYGSSKRRRGRPPKISGEESEGEGIHGNPLQGGMTADGEESRTEVDGKDVKVEVEELGKEEMHDEGKDAEGGGGRTTDSAGPSNQIQHKDEIKIPKEEPEHTRESPGSEWTSAIVSLHPPPPVPMKRPRGRPPRVPRQPQDPSKWPPLLPKPSKATIEISSNRVSIPRTASDTASSGSLSSNSSGSSSVSPLFLTPTVSVFPSSMNVSSFDLTTSNISNVSTSSMNCPFPIELRDLSGAGLPGGVLPLSVELGIGPGEIGESIGDLGIRGTEHVAQNIQEMTEGVQMGIKVRGLDLMRYGRLENGIYKCTECEKLQILKTFKTSYSFQRHAYLYHEGSPKRFPCPVCGKEFSRPDKRKSHLKEKHGLFQSENAEQISELQES